MLIKALSLIVSGEMREHQIKTFKGIIIFIITISALIKGMYQVNHVTKKIVFVYPKIYYSKIYNKMNKIIRKMKI